MELGFGIFLYYACLSGMTKWFPQHALRFSSFLFGFYLFGFEFSYLLLAALLLLFLERSLSPHVGVRERGLAYFLILIAIVQLLASIEHTIIGLSFLFLRFIASLESIKIGSIFNNVVSLTSPTLLLCGPVQSIELDKSNAKGDFSTFLQKSALGLLFIFCSFIFLRVSPPLLDQYSSAEGASLIAEAWLFGLIFLIGLYFNFSGFIILVSSGRRICGQCTLDNFDSPWKSKSFTEFWRRWHISLGLIVQKNIFLPLSIYFGRSVIGSRNGMYFATFISFALLGIWHGPSLNFVYFGIIHGSMVVLERFTNAIVSQFIFVIVNPLSFYVFMYGYFS